MKKIVVIEPGYISYEQEIKMLADFKPVIEIAKLNTPKEEVCQMARNADALMVREAVVDKQIIDSLEQCKIIVRYGVGVDNIDLEYAKQKNIYVANVPDYGSEDVAEHALSMILGLNRRLITRDKDVRAGIWGVGQKEPMRRLSGKVLGVVGCGRIAQCFIKKASGIGFVKTLVADPLLTPEKAQELNVDLVSLEELLGQSDYVSLHAPLLPSTKYLINQKTLALMKPNALLVNTSRGGLIDESALVSHIKNNPLFFAALDVFEKEPVDINNELLKLPNLIVSDHTAWFTEESVMELQSKAAQQVHLVFSGNAPTNWVNR